MSIQFKTEVTVSQVIEYLRKYSDFDYNSIRASDDPNPRSFSFDKKRTERLILNKRVQICLIDKTNLILNSFRVVFPERYLK